MAVVRFEEEKKQAEWVQSLLRDPHDKAAVMRDYLFRALQAERVGKEMEDVLTQSMDRLVSLAEIARTFSNSLPKDAFFFGKEGGKHYASLAVVLRRMQESGDCARRALNAFPVSTASTERSEAEMLFGYALELEPEISELARACTEELAGDREKTQKILQNAALCREMLHEFYTRELSLFYSRTLKAADSEGSGRQFRFGEINALFGELIHRIGSIQQMIEKHKTGGSQT